MEELNQLEKFVNLDDQKLIKLNKSFNDSANEFLNKILKQFHKFKPI